MVFSRLPSLTASHSSITNFLKPRTKPVNDKVNTESLRVLEIKKGRPWIGIRRKGGHWIYESSGTKLGKKALSPGMLGVINHFISQKFSLLTWVECNMNIHK